ncbi:PaaI family thioesterase [Methylobrevis pamukkalensis]|uniref:Thioesterase superfamily protein n=1 Tax=Methylobrevis pamukkalensis TaxID=1439726 RepID=A0A1E3GYI3_9HYPH|nr:PaaI family thioesterase [Methylobrevis pamukkalensis]ODN68985.1 Thioesterase superfamily protein [Methylobrevis pamukkalensis]
MQPLMTVDELNAFLAAEYPELNGEDAPAFAASAVAPGRTDVRFVAGLAHLRPGGTVSGPSMMTLADIACWLVILAHVGTVALTVTTHLSIDFLRKPAPGALIGRARLMKLGSRLAIADCDIVSEADGALVAHASATYSIPPKR